MDVPTPFYYPDTPSPIEEGKVSAVRQRLLHCVHVSGLVPTDMDIGFIMAGIDVDPVHDCYFSLPYYLVVTGTLSLSIANLIALNSFVVSWMVGDNVISVRKMRVIAALEGLGKVMVLFEILCFSGGLVYMYSNLKGWQYEDPMDRDTYCIFGEVVFSSVFVGADQCVLCHGHRCSTLHMVREQASQERDGEAQCWGGSIPNRRLAKKNAPSLAKFFNEENCYFSYS